MTPMLQTLGDGEMSPRSLMRLEGWGSSRYLFPEDSGLWLKSLEATEVHAHPISIER